MELKKHLLTPGLKIEDVFKRVRVGVKNRTSRKPTPQIPWENSSLMGDFYFVPQTDGTVISSTSSQNTELIRPNDYNADEEAWNDIRNSSNPEDFITFIRHFGDSPLADTAKFKLDRLKKEQPDGTERVKNLKLSDGSIYTGEFKDNKANGQGTRTWPDGRKYVGEYKDWKRNGQGTYTFPNGKKFEGEFEDGKRNGQGKHTFLDGKKYVGVFNDVNPIGQGITIFGPGQFHGDKYEGQHNNGHFHGQGTYTHADGSIYKGEYKDNKRTGYAIYIFASGNKYVGEFKNGDKNGQGTYTFTNGTKLIGEWKDDKMWNGKQYDKYGDIEGKTVNGVWRSQ